MYVCVHQTSHLNEYHPLKDTSDWWVEKLIGYDMILVVKNTAKDVHNIHF